MRIPTVVRRSLPAFVVLMAVASVVFPAAPPGKVLRFHPNEGATAAYNVNISSRIEVKEEAGEKQRLEMSTQTKCRVEFLGETAGGDFGVRGLVDAHTVKANVSGSQQEQESPEVAARYILNPQGRIKTVSWLSADPRMGSQGQGLTANPDDAFLLSGAAILPDKAVTAGAKWSGTVQVPGSGMGEEQRIKYDSVLLGEERFRGAVCQKIKTKATVSLSTVEDAPDGSGRVSISAKGTGVATWLFDAERGMIVSINASNRISVTARLTDSGQTIGSFAVSGVVNTTSVLSEFNGIPTVP